MAKSFISSQFQRAGDILKRGASDQILDYTKRFDTVKEIYDSLLKDIIRKDFDASEATRISQEFFGSRKVGFAAVDGTEYTRPMFDLVIFFGGSYASKGTVEFSGAGPQVEYSTRFVGQGIGVSSCVPMYVSEVTEVEQSFMESSADGGLALAKPLTDETVVNNSQISNWIMTFSEFYLAYKMATDPAQDVKILLMDRSLGNMQSSLIYETRRKLWDTCAIFECDIGGAKIDENDLAYNRHRVVNIDLRLPAARGDYLRYAPIYLLEKKGPKNLTDICVELRIDSPDRRKRLTRFLSRSVAEGFIAESEGVYRISPQYEDSWNRVKALVEYVGKQLFEKEYSGNPLQIEKRGKKCWITTLDLAFLTLFTLNMLIEQCWEKRILLLGITKDTTARDFKTHLIPVCINNKIWNSPLSQDSLEKIPSSDRMLLQYASIHSYDRLPTPWSLIEYDSAFRTIVPELERREPGFVSGAIRNRISPERLFLKTYIQLSESHSDSRLRSNVLFMDRLVYPEYDQRAETVVSFDHRYGGAVEPVDVILFRNAATRNELQTLIMLMLKAMAKTSVPEAFGHNMPLYIADSIAKWHNNEIRRIIDSTSMWIANNHDLRRFVFYMSTFRERRSEFESSRREA